MISSASFVLVGGINWALTKSMHKSLAIGAVVAGGAYAAMKLLKNWYETLWYQQFINNLTQL